MQAGLEPQVRARTADLQTTVAELRIADRNKNQFLAMLGHELRNPLASISAGLSLLRIEGLPAKERAQALQVMERQLQNMVALLNDVLDVSRLAYGKVQLQKRIHRVDEMVQAAAQTCQELIAGRRHALDIQQCQRPCLVHCDRAAGRADDRQPAAKRGQVHRPGRGDSRPHRTGKPRGPHRRDRHRLRHERRGLPRCLRPVQPVRLYARPRARWYWASA